MCARARRRRVLVLRKSSSVPEDLGAGLPPDDQRRATDVRVPGLRTGGDAPPVRVRRGADAVRGGEPRDREVGGGAGGPAPRHGRDPDPGDRRCPRPRGPRRRGDPNPSHEGRRHPVDGPAAAARRISSGRGGVLGGCRWPPVQRGSVVRSGRRGDQPRQAELRRPPSGCEADDDALGPRRGGSRGRDGRLHGRRGRRRCRHQGTRLPRAVRGDPRDQRGRPPVRGLRGRGRVV